MTICVANCTNVSAELIWLQCWSNTLSTGPLLINAPMNTCDDCDSVGLDNSSAECIIGKDLGKPDFRTKCRRLSWIRRENKRGFRHCEARHPHPNSRASGGFQRKPLRQAHSKHQSWERPSVPYTQPQVCIHTCIRGLVNMLCTPRKHLRWKPTQSSRVEKLLAKNKK